jgi:hypothetical protein
VVICTSDLIFGFLYINIFTFFTNIFSDFYEIINISYHKNLCDFDDVSDMEIYIMYLWNHCVKEKPILLRCELPCRMIDFIVDYAVPFVFYINKDKNNSNKSSSSHECDEDGSRDTIKERNNDEKDNKTRCMEEIVLFILSRWDEVEMNRSYIEYCIDLFYRLVEQEK